MFLIKPYLMNVLLIDDHPMIMEGYISILNQPTFKYYKITSCEQFSKWIHKGIIPDIAVVDYSMPAFTQQNLHSGIDCAVLLKKYAPNCKIIMITGHEESIMLYNIYEQISLDALIVKSDFTPANFKQLIFHNIFELPYFSPVVKKAIKTIRGTLLDSKNREILSYLSHGFKIIELQNFVSLSTSGVQKRIIKMLQEFNVSDYQELIVVAKKEGFL